MNKYWVGGAGNWSSTSHWSTSSGGASGASAPTSADDVYFDTNSGSLTGFIVTFDTTADVRDLNISRRVTIGAAVLTSNLLSIYGSLTITGTQVSIHIDTAFKATSTGKTITTNGAVITNMTSAGLTFDGVGGGWTLQDTFTVFPSTALSDGITLQNGTLNTNGQTVFTSSLYSSFTSARSLILGASTIQLLDINNGGGASVYWDLSDTTNLTFDAGTSTIQFAASFTGSDQQFLGGGLNYYNLQLFSSTSGSSVTIYGSNSFNGLTAIAGANVILEAGTTQTCQTIDLEGSQGHEITLRSTSTGATTYLSATDATAQYVDVQDNSALGAGIPFVDTPGGIDSGHNFNWFIGSPVVLPITGVDLEDIQPGDTCRFLNFSSTMSDIFRDNMLITEVKYNLDSVEITVELVKSGLLDIQAKQGRQISDIGNGGLGIPESYS